MAAKKSYSRNPAIRAGSKLAGNVAWRWCHIQEAFMFRSAVSIASLLLALWPKNVAIASDTPGVTATEIVVGATFPFSGPASALGNVGKAFMGYVDLINDRGGVNGRKIRLIALDDAYTPSKSAILVKLPILLAQYRERFSSKFSLSAAAISRERTSSSRRLV